MSSEVVLSQFTALVSGQVGTAVVSTVGITWRAAGAVSTFWEIKGIDMKKFQVSPEKSKAAKFLFERNDGTKYTMQVVLNEDEKCGYSEDDIARKERVILEEARAHIRNQKHWPMNQENSTPPLPSGGASSSSSSSTSTKTGEKGMQSSKSVSGKSGVERPANPNALARDGNSESSNDSRSLNRSATGGGGGGSLKRAAPPIQSEQEREEESIKEHLLASNPELNSQFRELVVNDVVTEADFWATRRSLISSEMAKRMGNKESLESWWWRKISQEWLEAPDSKKLKLSLK
jgi:hypothetical protein